MSIIPASDEAQTALWMAYEALSEKNKREIVKHTAKHRQSIFRYWIEQADLARGCDQRKVVKRDGLYGAKLDKALKDARGGELAARIFGMFLIDTNIVKIERRHIPDHISDTDIEYDIDEQIADSDCEFALLAAAFGKCYPFHRNNDKGYAGAAEKEMRDVITRLNAHAGKFEEWASALRLASLIPHTDVLTEIELANKEAMRLAELIEKHRKETGCTKIEFKVPSDVITHVRNLCEKLSINQDRRAKIKFLLSIADALRLMNVSHRSTAERSRLTEMRDDAACEIEEMAKADDPIWLISFHDNGYEWMQHALELVDDTLSATQKALRDSGYERLSEFIGVGDVSWMPVEPDPRGDQSNDIPIDINEWQNNQEESAVADGLQNIPEESASMDFLISTEENNDSSIILKNPLVAEKNLENNVSDSSITIPTIDLPSKEFAGRNPVVTSTVLVDKEFEREAKVAEDSSEVEESVVTCDETDASSRWENLSITDVSKMIFGVDAKMDKDAVQSLAAKLADGGEYAIAYNLMFYASNIDDMTGYIPAWVYGSVGCGISLQATDQSAIAILQAFYQQYQESLFDELQGADRTATRLLLAAGAMEPALFLPITGAVSILQTLHLHEMPSFKELVDGVAKYGTRGVGLPRAALFSVVSADDLLRKKEDVQARAKEWLVARAPQFEIISRPGKDIWRAWISTTGPIGKMLGPVASGQTGKLAEIQALADKYGNSGVIDQECRHLYRNELIHRGELIRPALNMIRRHTNVAIDFVHEWIGVLESQPDGQERFDEQILTQLRRCFTDHTMKAKAELEEKISCSCSEAVRAGAKACLIVLNDLAHILEGHGSESIAVKARNSQRLLNDDLLRVIGLQLDEDGAPRLDAYSAPSDGEASIAKLAMNVVNSIAEIAGNGLPTWTEAAKARGLVGDHEATTQLIMILEREGSTDVAKRAEQERAQSIAQHRNSAVKRLKQAQQGLSDALTKGLFDAEEYERWAVRLAIAEKDLRSAEFVWFADIYLACDRLSDKLRERKSREITRLQKDIECLSPSAAQRCRLKAVLDAGDVHTVTDYMDRIRDQRELPEEMEVSPFIEFFGNGVQSAFELIERELRDTNSPLSLIERVKRREAVAGLHLPAMQATQARESAEFLRLWFRVKSERHFSETDGLKIFSFLGMHPRRIKVHHGNLCGSLRDIWDLEVDPLESRDFCPLACFGSGARGHYKILLDWRLMAAEDILQHARELGGGPRIVLYFGRMSATERRSLASDHGRGNVIVIDDILAFFLAGQRKGRLRSLFLCTLPFAHISPYTKAASLLPPEMFYGRHREILQLQSDSTDSSCLLYGGRQIGKTVLLRHVQRLFEAKPDGTHVATYIDLKGKEIGTNRSMDEIWLVIAEELEKRKIISGPIGRQVKHDWLFANIDEWLDGNANRHLLVLLDEADAFLAADARGHNGKTPFSACTVLKDLMERTNRRFKLVFAGLHNVQKSTKVSNNPLAHFGEPICIGAMTDAGESREAEALITEPFAAAGYFFESADLPARILAQTNYYPNLIQIYCDELLKYMQQRSRVLFPPDKVATPPYTIVAKTLEDVYEQQELREELRLRFKWTLELDRRFELIANILALNDVDCAKGLEVAEIRNNAHAFWASGFTTKDETPLSYESFRDLLEEMVGLGILRRAEPPNHYALRNPNVLNLIGSRDAVEKLLEDAHNWPPPDVYDPTSFRGQISEKDKSLRSPLNAAQEAKLKSGTNQVCVVCGCRAGHVGKVEEAIRYRFGRDGFVRVLKCHDDLSQFRSELSNLAKRKSGGTTVIVVPDSVRWDRNWISEASKRVSRFEKSKGAVCVVFVAEPEGILPMVPDIMRKKFENTNFITVEPWDDVTVTQWLQEAGHTALDAASRQCLAEITGNWPELLYEAVKVATINADNADGFRSKVMDTIYRSDRKQELYELFGLTDSVLAPLLFLCENGPGWSIEEISGLIGDADSGVGLNHVTNVMTWAEHVGLARRGPDGWRLDPGVKQVLSME